MSVGREFHRTLNSAILRVTSAHIPLLERWRELLADAQYTYWQNRPYKERPIQFCSDQDVLNALLGSVEFAAVPVRLLRTGREIVHCGAATSYSAGERMRGLFRGIPPLVHIEATKPWMMFHDSLSISHPNLAWRYVLLVQQLSLYRAIAATYREEVGLPCDWLDYWTITGRVFWALGLGNHAFRGLPFAVADLVRKRIMSRFMLLRDLFFKS
jgi:hypothetical protein